MPRPFRQSLSDGHAAEKAWVEEQHGHSLAVAHGVRIVADNFNPAKDHLQHPDAAGVFRIEIKNRGIRFTSKEDYPYDTVFLANIANHHKDLTSPLIYVLRSEPTGRWLWVCATDRDETWTTGFKRDKTRNSNVHILECPKSFLRTPDELRRLLLHHDVLDLLDGGTEAFRSFDRCDPGNEAGAGSTSKRKRGAKKEADPCVGRDLARSKTKCVPSDKRSKPCGR